MKTKNKISGLIVTIVLGILTLYIGREMISYLAKHWGISVIILVVAVISLLAYFSQNNDRHKD